MKQRWYSRARGPVAFNLTNGDALCRVDLREAAMGLGTRSRLRAIYG
jgi:hypothetical protein